MPAAVIGVRCCNCATLVLLLLRLCLRSQLQLRLLLGMLLRLVLLQWQQQQPPCNTAPGTREFRACCCHCRMCSS